MSISFHLTKEFYFLKIKKSAMAKRQNIPNKLELASISTSLSFIPLIRKLEKIAADKNNLPSLDSLLLKLGKDSNLKKPSLESSELEKDSELLGELMSYVFSPLLDKTEIRGAFIPFRNDVFYSSTLFKEIFNAEANKENLTKVSKQEEDMRIFYAFFNIAKTHYGLDLMQRFSKVISVTDSEKLTRFFDMKFDSNYVEVIAKKNIKPLTEEEKKFLKENAGDLAAWQSLICLNDFEFRGFIIISATDVTDEQIISNIREMLLSPETILSHQGFMDLQTQIRSLLKLNSIVLAVIAIQDESVYILNKGVELEKRNKFIAAFDGRSPEYNGSNFHKVYESGQDLLIDDLDSYENKTIVERDMFNNGIRNLYLTPLLYEKKVIGILEVFSPNAGDMY